MGPVESISDELANPNEFENIHTVNLERSRVSRWLWFSLGFIFMTIGLIGIPTPGLPTTPLMILAAACFAKSSQRFYDWIINHRLFGHHVKNYREGRGIPSKSKKIIIPTLWIFVLFAVFIGIPEHLVYVKITVLVLGMIGSIYILRIKTLQE